MGVLVEIMYGGTGRSCSWVRVEKPN